MFYPSTLSEEKVKRGGRAACTECNWFHSSSAKVLESNITLSQASVDRAQKKGAGDNLI